MKKRGNEKRGKPCHSSTMNRRKRKKRVSQLLVGTLLFSMGSYSINLPSALATELSVTDKNKMLGATAVDWQSTNLREWLNTDKEIVDYTGIAPTYKNESGFLSNDNFTESERNAIAVTRHGAGWQYALEGNINDTPYISQRSVAHNDYNFNDKVFILHYTDLANYLEKNKQLLNVTKKYYSNSLQKQTNKINQYDYAVNSGYYNSAYVNNSLLYSSTLGGLNTKDVQNVVPALSLKPDTVLPNGTKAKDLALGSIVTFGKYANEAIEWQVINKTDDGYPLLWSTKILTTKVYDSPGDINPTKSAYVNFNSYDVDIYSGNGQAKSWETGTKIDSTSAITILNDADLITPTNNTSITLQIKATDTKYSIRTITLPDGQVVKGDYAEWTLSKNGEYDILVENSIGVITIKHIVTKAINTPAVVTILTDKDDSTKWSNKPVNVTISANNNGVYTLTESKLFPSWMPIGGKRVRVTGTLKNGITDATAGELDMNATIRIRLTMKWYNSSQIGMSYPIIKEVSLKNLKEKGTINIDEIYTIPTNAYTDGRFSVSFMDGNSAYLSPLYKYEKSGFLFELLDKDDLKVEEIIFPDGNKVFDDHATYVINQAGSFTFSARDNRNKITSKTIELAIDTVKPTLNISEVKTVGYTDKELLKIQATDDLSGIKRIKLPNGEYRTNNAEGKPLSIDYNVVKNGAYTFEAEDFAGNITKKTIQVSTIDTTPPLVNSELTPSVWTNGNVTIKTTASDEEGVVNFIQLPNGNKTTGAVATYTVSANGDYQFLAEDKAGYQTAKAVKVANIDKEKPTATYETTHLNGDNHTVKLTASDSLSGIKRIKSPNGTYVNGETTTYPIKTGETLTFEIEDNAGNVLPYEVKVSPPELTVYQKDNHVKAEWGIDMLDEDVLIDTSFESGENKLLKLNGFDAFNNVYYQEGESYMKVVNNSQNIVSQKYAKGEQVQAYFQDNGVTSLSKVGVLLNDDTYTAYYKFDDGTSRLEYRRVGNGQLSIQSGEAFTGDKSLRIGQTNPCRGNWTGSAGIICTNQAYISFNKIKGIPSGTDLSLNFTVKNKGTTKIGVNTTGELREITSTYYGPANLPLVISQPAPKGSTVLHVNNLAQMPDTMNTTIYLSMEKLNGEMTDTFTYYLITNINKEKGTITLNKGLTKEVNTGFELQRYSWGSTGSFNDRNIVDSKDWQTVSINTKVVYDQYYDILNRGFTFRMLFDSTDETYLDDIKFGYATKARLFRGDKKIYEGLLSDYEDKEAVDVSKPNPVAKIDVASKQGAIFMDMKKPEDTGTSYDYTVKAISNKGDSVSSETKKVTVTSGIEGYSYVVDTQTSTIPDDKVDTKSENVQIPITGNQLYYIHVKAIDKAGNVSNVSHIPFQDNVAPNLSLTTDSTAWKHSVQITAYASDTGLGVKRILLPSGTWVNGNTALYPVSANATYTFKAEDMVGNQTTQSIVISNIDNEAPTAPTISTNEVWTKTTPVSVAITPGRDSQSGVKRVEYKLEGATTKEWTAYVGAFNVINEGVTKVRARTVDNLEQLSIESVSNVRIDTSVPHNTAITIQLK